MEKVIITEQKTTTKSRARSHSQSSKRKNLVKHLSGALGGATGDNAESYSPNRSGFSQIAGIGLGLLHSYNTRTDAKGGLTDQILGATESMLTSGLGSEEFNRRAGQAVKMLLAGFAAKSMKGNKSKEADSNSDKLSKSAKAIAMALLAKKVAKDLLGKKSTSESGSIKEERLKELLTVLKKHVKRGKHQANNLESDSTFGIYMQKAKSLAKGLRSKKSQGGDLSDDEEEGPRGRFSTTIKLFAQQILRSESTDAFLISKASKYGFDSGLAIQAKELLLDFDMDKAKALALAVAGTFMDKGNSRAY